jgi:hypothetical protein
MGDIILNPEVKSSKLGPGFPDFFGNAVVNRHNSDFWEFGKGAPSELRCWGVAVGGGREVRGWWQNTKAQNPNEK